MKRIKLYVDYKPVGEHDFPAVLFYCDEDGKDEVSGKVDIPREGAHVTWQRVRNPKASFEFRDLCVHPVEVDRSVLDRVEFNWYVDSGEHTVHLLGGKSEDVQIFSYTLSLNDRGRNRIVYRDPEVVNTGGGGGP